MSSFAALSVLIAACEETTRGMSGFYALIPDVSAHSTTWKGMNHRKRLEKVASSCFWSARLQNQNQVMFEHYGC